MKKDYLITNYGAVADDTTLNTQAIQRAIDDAALDGGRVVVPSGTFRTGTVFLRSGVELHLSRGAVLSGSQRDEDYPEVTIHLHGETMQRAAGLITALYMTDIAVTGPGTINGNGKIWWHKFWGEDKQGGIMAEYEKRAFAGRQTALYAGRVRYISPCAKIAPSRVLPWCSPGRGICIFSFAKRYWWTALPSAITTDPARTALISIPRAML